VVADFDRDGDLDVACAKHADNQISWYRNNGGTPPDFGAFLVDSAAHVGPFALAVGDVDRNGFPDLAVVSETDSSVVWYENDGTPADGEWTPGHLIDGVNVDGPKDIALADLDRDGDLDFVVADYAGDSTRWYENDGTPSGWTTRLVDSWDGPRSVSVADFDGDGDLDVLISSYDLDLILLARSNGGSPPSFSSWPWSVTADRARTVVAADLDSDGDVGGAAVQGAAPESWYEPRRPSDSGSSIASDPLGGEPWSR
jgi:hypothetical protein